MQKEEGEEGEEVEEKEEETEEKRGRADGPVQIDSETGSEECSMKDEVLYCCGCEGRSVTQRTRGPQRARVLWCQCPPSPHPKPRPIVIPVF